MALVPVFVYGTLRSGEGNFSWAQACVERVDEDATIHGRLYFVFKSNGYPVAEVDTSTEDTIVGDILWCDNSHPTYGSMVRMEVQAGYEMILTEATLPNGNTLDVYVFDYKHIERAGDRIKDGDWRRAHYENNVAR